jgi:hypothetical protein
MNHPKSAPFRPNFRWTIARIFDKAEWIRAIMFSKGPAVCFEDLPEGEVGKFSPKVLENSTHGFNPVSRRPGLRVFYLTPLFAGKPSFPGMSLPALFLSLELALGLLSLSPTQGTVGMLFPKGLSGKKAPALSEFSASLPVEKFFTHRKSD